MCFETIINNAHEFLKWNFTSLEKKIIYIYFSFKNTNKLKVFLCWLRKISSSFTLDLILPKNNWCEIHKFSKDWEYSNKRQNSSSALIKYNYHLLFFTNFWEAFSIKTCWKFSFHFYFLSSLYSLTYYALRKHIF